MTSADVMCLRRDLTALLAGERKCKIDMDNRLDVMAKAIACAAESTYSALEALRVEIRELKEAMPSKKRRKP